MDAFVPQDGESVMDLLPKALPSEVAQAFLAGFRDSARQGTIAA